MSFNKDIAALMLEKARTRLNITSFTSAKNPRLIILGGQPGSGKSSAIEKLEDMFNDNIIALNGDDFKTFYPEYDELLKKDWRATSKAVQPYSNYVIDELKKEFADKKFNLIIEGTMRTAKIPMETVTTFKAKAYQIEAYAVATHYYASRIGCLYRMEKDNAASGSGRGVPVESHDEAYNNIPNTIEELIKSGQLDNFTVISRDGTV